MGDPANRLAAADPLHVVGVVNLCRTLCCMDQLPSFSPGQAGIRAAVVPVFGIAALERYRLAIDYCQSVDGSVIDLFDSLSIGEPSPD